MILAALPIGVLGDGGAGTEPVKRVNCRDPVKHVNCRDTRSRTWLLESAALGNAHPREERVAANPRELVQPKTPRGAAAQQADAAHRAGEELRYTKDAAAVRSVVPPAQ